MAMAITNLDLQWSPWHIPYLIVIILSGTLIEFSITLALACIAFWTGRSAATINTVMQVSFVIQRYPVEMYGKWFRAFVTLVVPVAFINYYPPAAVGQADPR
jgi:ABC-2 type transport system permease protein